MSETARNAEGRPTNRDLAIVVVVCLVMLAAVVTYLVTSNSTSEIRQQSAVAREAFTSGNLEVALKSAEAAVKAGADDTATLNLLGQAREAKGDLSGAERAFGESLRRDPNQPLVLHELAVIAVSRDDLDSAESSLRKALADDEKLAGSRLLLADVLAKKGRSDEARAQYEAVLEAAPHGVDLNTVRAKLEALPR
ncbi:MAG TPA: tetratricopeptide repeat protein [Coriobacteriia bacterium]|nr:tetratricopeptide repeat protein [Coriobacteriia bacterium]